MRLESMSMPVLASDKIFKQPTRSSDPVSDSPYSIKHGKKKFAFCVAEDINAGAGYVMAQLRAEGHDVKLFFDPRHYNRGHSKNVFLAELLDVQGWMIRQMKAYKPDVACFSVLSATYQWGVTFAECVKTEVGCRIVFGGTMSTLVPEIVAENWFIDEVVQGDGVKYFGGKFEPDALWTERDDFFNELPPEYRRTQLFMTSYGCPYNCTFCGNQQLREVGQYIKLKRSAGCAVKELKHLKDTYGMQNVLFVDDIFTLDKKWMMEFLAQYKAEVNCAFGCFGHVNAMDEPMVEALAAANCRTVWLGIQSGCEDHRKRILDRPETNAQIIRAAGWLKKYGIKIMVDHICGLPYESDITHERSLQLYTTIGADVVNVYECLYFPKAKLSDFALECGYLVPENILKIDRGEAFDFPAGNRSRYFYDTYAKALIAVPLKNGIGKSLPMSWVRLLVHLQAGSGYIPNAMIQNPAFFTYRAILKKTGLYREPSVGSGRVRELSSVQKFFSKLPFNVRPYTFAKVND